LTFSPAGDVLTSEFAMQLIENESIGADTVTDFLSVSFSSSDYVGHAFGPSSLEAEDNLLRLDRTLAELLSFVDKKVGLKNTLVVLSSDHGSPEVPAQLKQHGFEADYVKPETWDSQAGIASLKEKFGIGEALIQAYSPPYIYLNHDVIRERGLALAAVEKAVAEEVMKFKGVSLAISSTALMEGRVPDTWLTRSILNSHHPGRSGDVFIVFEPHWFINQFGGIKVASTHGSPWRYDTYVPLVFAGAGLTPQRIYREVHTVDVATTLAAFTGTKPPSGASGEILAEVLKSK